MAEPVPVPATPVVPLYPPLGSASFNQDSYAYGSAMPAVSIALGALAKNTFDNSQISHSNTLSAIQAAALAESASNTAVGAVNFKGLWAGLTGPISKPATVKHNERFWLLLNDLANIALSEPGVSADWTSGDTGALIQVLSASAEITPGPIYSVVVPEITLTIPASLNNGDSIIVRNTTAGIIYIDWNGHTLKGQTPVSPMRVPRLRGFTVIYNGSTLA